MLPYEQRLAQFDRAKIRLKEIVAVRKVLPNAGYFVISWTPSPAIDPHIRPSDEEMAQVLINRSSGDLRAKLLGNKPYKWGP
jgi:hypothetical protein